MTFPVALLIFGFVACGIAASRRASTVLSVLLAALGFVCLTLGTIYLGQGGPS